MMKTLVFVDDKRLNLKALKKSFEGPDMQSLFFNQDDQALDYLATSPVDLLCVDMHMEGLDIIKFLEAVQEGYPLVMRVAMVDINNKALIKQLTDEGLAHHLVYKPWDKDEVYQDLTKILASKKALYSKVMMNFIQSVDGLPTLPHIYDVISNQVKRHASISEISKTIAMDLSLTAFVLKVANSAFYGRKTGSVTQGIMKIGLSNLKEIVLTYSVFNSLGKDKKALEKIWSDAILTNKMVVEFYDCCLKEEMPSTYASVGLLHDIGCLFLMTYKDRLGLVEVTCPSHENLGGYLLSQWDLPLPYVEGAMFHHRPLDSRVIHRKLVYVLYLVHYFQEAVSDEQTRDIILDILKLDYEVVKECLERFED